MFSERDMESAIVADPEKYLGEQGLRLISQQYRIGSYIFDLLFQDKHGAKMIVEIQKGTLDRSHTYKILDYYHEYKEKNPADFIELMVIANKIPDERKKRLSDWGVSYKEVPEADFIKRKDGAMDQDQRDQDALTKGAIHSDSPTQVHQIIDGEISSVGLPLFKPKFQRFFDSCNESDRVIFLSVVGKLLQPGIRHWTTDKPDYRLGKKHVFCELVLLRQGIKVLLRVDDHTLFSNSIELKKMSKTEPGKRWYTFRLDSGDQIEEAVRLIKKVYEFSD